MIIQNSNFFIESICRIKLNRELKHKQLVYEK